MKNLSFNLVDNAIDSIKHAVELLAYSKDLDHSVKSKRAILSIAHAIELLLKERLRQVHPSLIWENVDRYGDLNSRTVSSEGALRRLNKIGGLALTKKDENLINSLKKTRNAIEHYTWTISKEEADHIIGSSLSFAVSFLKTHLDIDLLGYAERDGGVIQDIMDNNSSFAHEYTSRQEDDIKIEKCSCSFCNALITVDDQESCSKCGHWYRNDNFMLTGLDEDYF